MGEIADFLQRTGVATVEALVADMNGVLRGKAMPAAEFAQAAADGGIRLASSLLAVTLTGSYAGRPGHDDIARDPDLVLLPDPGSLALGPGGNAAWAFGDAVHLDGSPWRRAPRQALKGLVERYEKKGWRIAAAPELEFYLTAPLGDPTTPCERAPAPSGRPVAPSAGGAEALAQHAPFLDAFQHAARAAGLPIGTAIGESGPGQLEINLDHGEPVRRADQALIFKRLARDCARALGLNATFVAQVEREAPSGMHLHLSLVEARSGASLFAAEHDGDTPLFLHFLGGLQKYLPQVAPLYAPNVNSYRRMRPRYSAPVNVAWGRDNRTCGLRIPHSDAANRRVEIRLAGADANPYLAMAAALGAGWLGICEAIEPAPEATGNAYDGARPLPRTLDTAMERFAACEPMRDLLGDSFVAAYLAVKQAELEDFQATLTPWEREHILRQI